MGDESLILREDGCVHVVFPINSLTYHNNLNVILVRTASRAVYVLDVNSGVILESTCLSADDGGVRGIHYAPGADRVFVWDSNGVGARTDYNGVLLLQTALQRPLPIGAQLDKKIRLELVLSEALLLSQCLDSIDSPSIEGLSEFVSSLKEAISKVPTRKGVKAQKWSTVTLELAQSTFRFVTSGVVQELKDQNRRIPALAIASAIGQRANDLVPCTQDEEARALMYSEAERKETFKRWPHMDYKWALPARMAQAGFYHQPTPNGDDRAMCFTCLVCLVCWEKSDEPWVEHERHSPNCPFVRGEYTHNVPISVTNATSCAVASPNVVVVSRNSTTELIASGTADGKINIWKFDTGLKLAKYIHISPYDAVFSGMVNSEVFQVWPDSMEKEQLTYSVELTAMAFLGVSSTCSYLYNQREHAPEKENRTFSNKPSLLCGIIINKSSETDKAINDVDERNKAIFESCVDKSTENIKAMNDQNEAKNLTVPSRQLLLLTYDIYSPNAGSVTGLAPQTTSAPNKAGGSKKVYSVPRADDSNIYDEIYVHYSDDDTDLVCTNLIEEQISNVINLNASSSKEDKSWDSKKLFAKHFKVLAPAPSMVVTDYPEAAMSLVNKVSQIKSWTSGMACIGTKLADQLDAAIVDDPMDPLTHYLNLNGPLSISDFKCYEGHINADSNEKVKLSEFVSKVGTQPVTHNNNDSFENVPQPEEVITQGIAIQCVRLPAALNLSDDARITHLIPIEDKSQLLVVISSIDVNSLSYCKHVSEDQMEVDEQDPSPSYEPPAVDSKAYILIYKMFPITSLTTLEDLPLSYIELPHAESPVDLCRLPSDKGDIYNFASVGIDGNLRIYQLPTFKTLTVKMATKSPFTSVVYCTGVERLSVSTKNGRIYFYSMKCDEDSLGEEDEEHGELSNMAPGPPTLLAHKTAFSTQELESLISLTGSYGTNNAVPYNAVVPGFWCELSPAQRSRFDSNHNSRMWRLQNTSSTWDEHLLELTLPYSVSLAHVDFGFTLHGACTNGRAPTIQVTLLKQNLHGIGFRSDDDYGDSPDMPMPFPSYTEEYYTVNPVNTEEYLRAHNAEILAGPLKLSSGLDMSQQSGTLILTSPRLYRAKGRTFLIHIKTLLDSKDMAKMPAELQRLQTRASFVGCDWLHQISITVRSNPHTEIVPSPKQQRITMLQSNQFLNTVLTIATSREDSERRKIALDLIIWVVSIRLQRLRLVADKDKDEVDSVEMQQLECVKIVEKHLDALFKNCILCAKRSIAKKCVKIILITSEGARQLPDPKKSTFKETLGNTVANAIPYLGACESPGAMRWMSAIAMRESSGTAGSSLLQACLKLLEKLAKCLNSRTNFYHGLLRSRFGLYGLPLERTIFEQDGPVLSKGTSTPLSLATMVAMDTTTSCNPCSATPPTKPDYQMRNLYNFSGEIDGKIAASTVAWWSENPGVGVFSSGLSETQALHVTCHVASDGTKLESNGTRHNHNFGSISQLCTDPNSLVNTLMEASHWHNQPAQFWKALKDDTAKPVFVDPDSLEDAEMECDHNKMEMPEDNIFKDPNEPCMIPWSQLVSRPPLHTLLVERMHSGARRYIILDFGHVVRLSDVIIPACSDLVTLGIDIWLEGEETDSVKLAYSMDIATKHLVLSDIQPPPLCRYMKITTIGRYGMSAMKCKIPLGWFYGEVAQITNTPASVAALHALHEDLTCRFRLATGKLIDLLRPYMELYYANVAHMMAYFNMQTEADPKVISSYQECIDIQQQLHTVTNTLKKLQSNKEFDDQLLDLVESGAISSDELLERSCTDKLRVMTENVIDMLLHIFFEVGHEGLDTPVSPDWCGTVSPLLWASRPRAAAGLSTLLPRICGHSGWWGAHLADTLQSAFEPHDDPPKPLNRILLLSMFMCRFRAANAAPALANRALSILDSSSHQPALIAAILAVISAATEHDSAYIPHERWEWVTGGRASSYFAAPSTTVESSSTRGDCKLNRRNKLNKKLLYQMHDIEQKRPEDQVNSKGRGFVTYNKATRLNTFLGNKSAPAGNSFPTPVMYRSALLPRELARSLAQALVKYMLAADSMHHADTLMLAAKVTGSLCLSSGGPSLLDPSCILGLARLSTTLPTWQKHSVTNLLQDIIESDKADRLDQSTIRLPPAIRPIRKSAEDPTFWRPPKNRAPPADSDESDSEDKSDSGPPEGPKRTKYIDTHAGNSNISGSVDARLETCTEALSESAARMLLLTGSEALTAAIRAPTSYVLLDPPEFEPEQMMGHPLKRTLHDVFRHLATEFRFQVDCQFMEHVMSLWMTLNGTNWGTTPGERTTSWNSAVVINDGPRIRLSNDTVEAILKSLVDLDNVTLRCWILCLQALSWISNQPVEGEEGSGNMCDVIMQCEYFVPAMVKFINMNVNNDGAVFSSEQYLSGVSIGAGSGAVSTLMNLLNRVSSRGSLSAGVTLQIITGAWQRGANTAATYDLHSVLIKIAHALVVALTPEYLPCALQLIDTIASLSGSWVNSLCGRNVTSMPRPPDPTANDSRLSGLLADVVSSNPTPKRLPLRRAVITQLLHYANALVAVPLSRVQPKPYMNTMESMTDERKQQAARDTNVDDERKQRAIKTPCLADTVLQNPLIMKKLFKALAYCETKPSTPNASVRSKKLCQLMGVPESNSEQCTEPPSLNQEVYGFVAHMAEVASKPGLIAGTLLDYIRGETSVQLSESLQHLMMRLFDKPEVLCAFIDRGGLDVTVTKLCAYHMNQLNTNPGLVSSLMNYMKLPILLVNNASNPATVKKNLTTSMEAATGLYNYAPLCTISCDNPTAQPPDVLLGAGSTPNTAGAGPSAARRVRSAAWSYHFFSADETTLSLMLTLPYAVQLHEIQLQPHLSSLATCPGAVAVEAGCNGTMAPLGPPQNTSGMSFIRLVVANPIICTNVQLRLYKPRDSSNMGLLQLRLLGSPAFGKMPAAQVTNVNNWAYILSACISAGLPNMSWLTVTNGSTLRALAWLVLGTNSEALYASRALLRAAKECPTARESIMYSLLALDTAAHSQAFQWRCGSRGNVSMSSICELLRRLCAGCSVQCSTDCTRSYIQWLSEAAQLRFHTPPSAALVQTLASILWMLMDTGKVNLYDMITENMFDLIYGWLKYVPDTSLLKKSLDSVLCSMCYIKPELFRLLLTRLDIPVGEDERLYRFYDNMEGLTDDGKVEESVPEEAPAEQIDDEEDQLALKVLQWQLNSLAAAALSPTAVRELLRSPLLSMTAQAIAKFSKVKGRELKSIKEQPVITTEPQDVTDTENPTNPSLLIDFGTPTMKSVCAMIDFLQPLCTDRRLKDWMGTEGAVFWRPLLLLLCYPRPNESAWKEGQHFEELEESTIRLFAELTTCHYSNQKLFATTLHGVLETIYSSEQTGVTGFTRALILRLLLSVEKCTVVAKWSDDDTSVEAAAPGSHPMYSNAPHQVPVNTTVGSLIKDGKPAEMSSKSSPTGWPNWPLGRRTDLTSSVCVPWWEIPLAAGSASKDRRLKDIKNTIKAQYKKRFNKINNDANTQTLGEAPEDGSIQFRANGINGIISPAITIGQLSYTLPHMFGPHVTLDLLRLSHVEGEAGESSQAIWSTDMLTESYPLLREFGACGGLALVASRLPRPHTTSTAPQTQATTQQPVIDSDWVKLEDFPEEVLDMYSASVEAVCPMGGVSGGSDAAVPPHALSAVSLLLKLPGYAAALLGEGSRAVQLLRLLLGVTHDEDGKLISVGANTPVGSLGTLPFGVVSRLLDLSPRDTEDGRLLRRLLLNSGAVKLVLTCLAVFTHHKPNNDNSQGSNGSTNGRTEDKSQLYWAKGTGFGTGSIQQSWNVEQALVRQRTEEEHVTVLMQVIASYINCKVKWPPEDMSGDEGSTSEESPAETPDADSNDLPPEFIDLIANSSLVPAICSYLRNDSVLDMSRHIPLYLCVLSCARALFSLRSSRLTTLLAPLPRLLRQMSTTTNSYATKLRMNKKDILNKLTYYHKKYSVKNMEIPDEDEGLAALIADIQATSKLMIEYVGEEDISMYLPRPMTAASREARYIEVMKRLQFETFEMITECTENGFRFTVPYHFEGTVRAAGDRSHPARMKRLAQEAATLASSLPLSFSSSVFVRTDTDRLDVMKVLITGPSDTPYANGCFILDVYFPADYPSVPMLINLETTGRHSVRFNPNLYNDGKVCLSVLNTWHGRPEEKWNAHTSSFLQVLVSIQSLILVPEPYFNEPGYERSRGSHTGNNASTEYNSNIYQANVRWAMLDHLRNPEPCFKEVIQTHFWIKRNEIMQTISGWITELENQIGGDERTQRTITLNLVSLKRHYVKIQEELAKLPVPPGLEDLDEPFQLPNPPTTATSPVPSNPAQPPPPTSPAEPPAPQLDDLDHDMEKIVSQVVD